MQFLTQEMYTHPAKNYNVHYSSQIVPMGNNNFLVWLITSLKFNELVVIILYGGWYHGDRWHVAYITCSPTCDCSRLSDACTPDAPDASAVSSGSHTHVAASRHGRAITGMFDMLRDRQRQTVNCHWEIDIAGCSSCIRSRRRGFCSWWWRCWWWLLLCNVQVSHTWQMFSVYQGWKNLVFFWKKSFL